MKVTSITKYLNIKVNTGDFGNFDCYESMTASLDEGEDPAEASVKLGKLVLDSCLAQKAVLDDLDPAAYVYLKRLPR